jgi:hypothetical protein
MHSKENDSRKTPCRDGQSETLTDLGFDGIQRGDSLDRLGGGGRGMRDVDRVELAPGVGPTGDFEDRSRLVEMLEAGVGVGLERTLVELQVLARVLSLAVGRVGEPDGRRGCVARWPVVADIVTCSLCLNHS